MNKYWLVAFVLWSAGMFVGGIKYEGYKAGEKSAELEVADQKGTIKAEADVIAKQQRAAKINQKEGENYAKTVADIDADYSGAGGLYDTDVAAGGSVRPVPVTPRRTGPACPAPASKKYKLTPQQCDVEEAKLLSLWNWTVEQGRDQN